MYNREPKISDLFYIGLMVLSFALALTDPAWSAESQAISSQGQQQAINIQGAPNVRYLPVQGTYPMPHPNALFYAPGPDRGYNFVSVTQILPLLSQSRPWMEEFDEDILMHVTIMNAQPEAGIEAIEKMEFFDKAPVGFQPVALIHATSKGDAATMDLINAVAHKAAEYACAKVVFLREGISATTVSQSWGIGFAYTRADVGDGDYDGGVGGGGTGYAKSWGEHQKKPYIVAVVGY